MMELVNEAIVFAAKAHDGMRRKKSQAPYILHPMEAAVIVGTMTDDQNLIAAAALHDVVEDTDVTIEEVEERFGTRVRELVQSETEDKREDLPPAATWRIRKEESLEVLKNAEDGRSVYSIFCLHLCILLCGLWESCQRVRRINTIWFRDIRWCF